MKRGSLLVFEGLDGSGKSTQVAALAQVLLAAGHDVVTTSEPTRGPRGRRIREVAASGERVAPRELLEWFHEDRRAHVAELITPALDAGRVVLCDRYFLSTVAYQGALGIDPDEIVALSEAEHPLPDLAVLLDVDPEVGLARVRVRGAPPEPGFERPELLERVAEIYRGLERPYLVRIDARGDEAAVHRAVVDAVRACTGLLA